MKKILQTVLEAHLRDVEMSKKAGEYLNGLCSLGFYELSPSDNFLFKEYLQKNVDAIINKYVWDRDNTNTERQEWLIEHINLN